MSIQAPQATVVTPFLNPQLTSRETEPGLLLHRIFMVTVPITAALGSAFLFYLGYRGTNDYPTDSAESTGGKFAYIAGAVNLAIASCYTYRIWNAPTEEFARPLCSYD